MQANYLCTECENIDELSNFIEPVKDGYYYTATCNKCNNRTHILKEHKDNNMKVEQHPLYKRLGVVEQSVLESEMGENFYKDFETQEELESAIEEAMLDFYAEDY